MNTKTPKLTKIPDGRYEARAMGKRWRFGRDPDKAMERYIELLKVWR